MKKTFTFSIVSHKQISLVYNLLNDFLNLNFNDFEIIITINTFEIFDFSKFDKNLDIKVIENKKKIGFGQNHNNAFKISNSNYFCIVNPDIKFYNLNLAIIDSLFNNSKIGVIAPQVRNFENKLEDNIRLYPTIFNLIKRHLYKKLDYNPNTDPFYVDWAAGMFLFFRSDDFNRLNGFDTNYFMYLEDTDICLRYKSNGFKILYTNKLTVFHDARRNTLKSFKHLYWHLKSLIYFYFKNYKKL
jgi:N-acetylglucosaminyl-diphospho-decaprenol L-rhamnosyltransferase